MKSIDYFPTLLAPIWKEYEKKSASWAKEDEATEHFYKCTDDILLQLGQAYVFNSEVTENIDDAGGKGTADFACRAIKAYCGK